MNQTAYMLVGDYTEEDFLEKIIPHLATLRATHPNECIDFISPASTAKGTEELLVRLSAKGYAVFQVSVTDFMKVA